MIENKMQVINFKDKFQKFDEIYSPKIIAELNNYHFKLAKFLGDFVWHSHKETDEAFIVIEGVLEMHFRDKVEILTSGEMIVVPKGVEHKPCASELCKVLLVEPDSTLNTGDIESELTKIRCEWI